MSAHNLPKMPPRVMHGLHQLLDKSRDLHREQALSVQAPSEEQIQKDAQSTAEDLRRVAVALRKVQNVERVLDAIEGQVALAKESTAQLPAVDLCAKLCTVLREAIAAAEEKV